MKVKTIVVQGEMINRNKERVSTLAEKVDVALGDFLKDKDAESVKIFPQVSFESAAQGGSALFVITYEEKEKTVSRR